MKRGQGDNSNVSMIGIQQMRYRPSDVLLESGFQ
jgi:hypothetical protein